MRILALLISGVLISCGHNVENVKQIRSNNDSRKQGVGVGKEETQDLQSDKVVYDPDIFAKQSIDSSQVNIECDGVFYIIKMYTSSEIHLDDVPRDPYLTSIEVLANGGLVEARVYGSANREDLRLFDEYPDSCFAVFEYYSSPVGFTQYFVYDLRRKQILVTQKLDEMDRLADVTPFHFSQKKYRLADGRLIDLSLYANW